MARRWFVQDADNKLDSMSDDDTVDAPADTTAVLNSTIRAADPPGANGRIQSGGIWDGTSYTAPTGGGILPTDATPLGELKVAAALAVSGLLDWKERTDAVAYLYPAEDEGKVHDWEAWLLVGLAKVMLAGWTVAERVKFAENTATGTTGISTATEFYSEAVAAGVVTPTSPTVWANPNTGLSVALGQASNTVTLIKDDWAATPSYADLIDGSWIDDITA